MVAKVKASPDIFGRWLEITSSPIELLVLGAFRYLRRRLEECLGISKEVHRCFFHLFLVFGSTKLFKDYVISPNESNQDAATHQHECNIARCHVPMAVQTLSMVCQKEYRTRIEIKIKDSKCLMLR
jgi:hypothetical protein